MVCPTMDVRPFMDEMAVISGAVGMVRAPATMRAPARDQE